MRTRIDWCGHLMGTTMDRYEVYTMSCISILTNFKQRMKTLLSNYMRDVGRKRRRSSEQIENKESENFRRDTHTHTMHICYTVCFEFVGIRHFCCSAHCPFPFSPPAFVSCDRICSWPLWVDMVDSGKNRKCELGKTAKGMLGRRRESEIARAGWLSGQCEWNEKI